MCINIAMFQICFDPFFPLPCFLPCTKEEMPLNRRAAETHRNPASPCAQSSTLRLRGSAVSIPPSRTFKISLRMVTRCKSRPKFPENRESVPVPADIPSPDGGGRTLLRTTHPIFPFPCFFPCSRETGSVSSSRGANLSRSRPSPDNVNCFPAREGAGDIGHSRHSNHGA